MSIRSVLKLPREHGAWAMLYVPFVLGVIVAGQISWPLLWLLLAVSALFVSRESFLVVWRARKRSRQCGRTGFVLMIYMAIAVAAGLRVVILDRFYLLLPLALVGATVLVINLRQASELKDRRVSSEIAAIIGLTLTAPAAFYVAHGTWDQTALWLWGLSAAFFSSSVFYIRLYVTGFQTRKTLEKSLAKQRCLTYHLFLLGSLVALAVTNYLSHFALLAFAPVFARTLLKLAKSGKEIRSVQIEPTNQKRLNLKRIGLAELTYAGFFLIFGVLAFSSSGQ